MAGSGWNVFEPLTVAQLLTQANRIATQALKAAYLQTAEKCLRENHLAAASALADIAEMGHAPSATDALLTADRLLTARSGYCRILTDLWRVRSIAIQACRRSA